jgi:protein-export SecD/SecF family membrane protein
MARTGPIHTARRVLVWLGVVIAVLTAVLAGGAMAGHASWAPKLALDLEGGTQMILAPKVEGGSDINEEQLNQAVAIIRQRVDGSGVAEAEISTQSGRNVVVSLPGTPSKETRALIQASADMNFRPVLQAGPGAAVPAKALSDQLRFGALPISFEIQSEQQISATLGGEQLRMGMLAGLIGLLLVVVYSLFQYRALGLVTVASLVVAGALTYLAIAILGWTENYRLSLAGVAGIIVAIGQTADSFIVYFERIRDELREGRGLVSAVENGWKRAKRTVLASKAVNLLAALVLYFVAVGNVRGFAFTLGLTALADLIVVFMFTHPTLQLLARTKFFGEGHRFSGLDPKRLGAVPLYRGAGRLRTPEDKPAVAVRAKNTGATAEAERRMTIAERRLAEKQEQLAGSSKSAAKEGN